MDQHPGRPDLRDPNAPQAASSSSFVWSDARLLGFTPMDKAHEEFYAVVFGLLTCQESGMLGALDAFESHAREHFEQEEEWMRRTEFPPRDCHIKEHEAVLREVREVRKAVNDGRGGPELVQSFAVYLFQWFPGHADYLDSALAAWITKRTLGGKPIVLRRSAGGA